MKNTPRHPQSGMMIRLTSAARHTRSPRRLHERERLAAMTRRKRLGDECHAGRPFAAHAEAERDAEDASCSMDCARPHAAVNPGVDEHSEHQRALRPMRSASTPNTTPSSGGDEG